MTNKGLGCAEFTLAVYLANTPNMLEYQGISSVNSLVSGEVNAIGQACGNGWRKVFNVYAKLLYALNADHFDFAKKAPNWQQYRDGYLLQAGSATALLFSPPKLDDNPHTLHIICGRTYAKDLLASGQLQANLIWLDDEFAIDVKNRLIVCPYFDYRQLSNIKIERLSVMLSGIVN
ncbi:hypothetical protein FR932_09290 [Moritella marina ATCC 15381]|uniref:Uncharacterized protein n=1 Tax=Moritella marina ATCC 15381 TaxID=1202962 RepID=A0A5J6WS49_MORMI|nr:hypothetical protein [Moritella marina]QFI40254.1 hypothetical protein FR932_09290 [Moritella marina ATCC 15381]